MSSTITWLIVGTLAISLSWALAKGVWSAVSKYRFVIQIILFGILMVCVARIFFTRENFEKLHEGVEKTGIGDRVEGAIMTGFKGSGATEAKPVATEKVVVEHREVKPVEPTPVEATPVEPTPVEPIPAEVTPVVKAEATAVVAPKKADAADFSQYDKGRKTFTYALPFNAKVSMSVKGGEYRLIAESMGKLSGSEKKEIGALILKSVSAYRGEEVLSVDKTKVSIEEKYDAAANRTKVFAIIPIDAVR